MSAIQKWYAGKTIFITGGSGFMGKVLLEKILRDLPDLKKVVLLIRPKRGMCPKERLEILKNTSIFERIRSENPLALEKIIVIEGNLDQDSLGLNAADRRKLIDVSVVFHMAAMLRFDAAIKDAVIANVLGTQILLELCKDMKNLQCFVYISTAFCYPEREILDEKLYEPQQNPYEIINYVQNEKEEILNSKMHEIIAPHPNSYTFSKRLAEWIVKDYRKAFPVIIARPSIVIPSVKEPIPGWVDSLNGVIGVIAAAGKGVLRSMLGVESNRAEVIPCDLAVNALITIPTVRNQCTEDLSVYNLNIPRDVVSITWTDMINTGKKAIQKNPFEWTLWYPVGPLRTNIYMHWLILILFQWIPAVFIDMLFFVIGRERFMIRVQKKIMVGLNGLQYFTMRSWRFETRNYEEMSYGLNNIDEKIFYRLKVPFDFMDYMSSSVLAVKKYIFKEKIENLRYVRIHYSILYFLHHSFKFTFYFYMGRLLMKLFGLDHLMTMQYWFLDN